MLLSTLKSWLVLDVTFEVLNEFYDYKKGHLMDICTNEFVRFLVSISPVYSSQSTSSI